MTYNQLCKKYGTLTVNKAYEAWESNGTLRVKGTLATTEIKGVAGKLHKCIEMIIKGEL